MTTGRMVSWLLAGLVCAAIPPAHGGPSGPQRAADPVRAKAQEASRQRLLAKLRSEAPKVHDTTAKTNPLELPIFHRHDRP